jgi:SAM-dependent methyltransferase
VVFDEYSSRPSPHQDPTFNTIGWNSSYTGRPIPEAEMQEWMESTVERILSLHPRRVLEIGCGTGLLLFRFAPRCTQYYGTDFSQAALRSLRDMKQWESCAKRCGKWIETPEWIRRTCGP